MPRAIGIDVGGTNLRIGVFDDMQLLHEARFQADFSRICAENPASQAWELLLNAIKESISSVLMQYQEIQGVGIGFPGFIDPVSGAIAQSPNLPGLFNVNLIAPLQSDLHLPVRIENDANAAAFGEYCLAGSPAGGLIYLGLGTGVGGGVILNGKPYAGQHGCAMEVGHIIVEPHGRMCGCGNRGCLEQYASSRGVSQTYLELSGADESAKEIAERAQAGDLHAQQAFNIAAETLARALATLLKVVDVSNVVIGGGMSVAWPLMQTAFLRQFSEDLIPVLRDKICVSCSESHDIAGMLGASRLILG